ncbi:MAG: integrase [Methylophagaceae bacterium]
MDRLTTKITPNIFGDIFGKLKNIVVADNSIVITEKDSTVVILPCSEILEIPSITRGFLGSKISIKHNSAKYNFSFLRRQSLEKVFKLLEWLIVQNISSEIDALNEKFLKSAVNEFLRGTWKEAVVRWFRENQDKKTIKDDVAHVKWVDPFIGEHFLDEVTRDKLDDITYAKLDTGVKPATVNRMMEVVRAILNRAYREWDWIDKAPYVRMLKEPKRRIRWLTSEEAQRILSFLPSHLVAMVRFSLATGLRESNVTGLEWSQVDLTRRVAWIHADQAKAGRSIGVPLNNEVIVLLRELQGNHSKFVFTYKGKPVKKGNTKAWRDALLKAGIFDFRWHDLRHTWASWHIQNGTPIHILQELGGWSDIRMVQRYAHLSSEHLSPYADSLCKLKEIPTTFSTTPNVGYKKAANH